jgi:hypothetical protein
MNHTTHAVLVGGVPEPLPAGDIITAEVTHPRQILSLWSAADLRAIGVYVIQETPIPEGKRSTGWTLQKSGQTVSRVHTLEDAPAPIPFTPDEISDRQFAHGLAKPPYSLMTQAEALAFVQTGTLPAAFEALIDALPTEVQFDVRMLVTGATVFNRPHPTTAILAAAFGWTDTQRDDFWRFAGAL